MLVGAVGAVVAVVDARHDVRGAAENGGDAGPVGAAVRYHHVGAVVLV